MEGDAPRYIVQLTDSEIVMSVSEDSMVNYVWEANKREDTSHATNCVLCAQKFTRIDPRWIPYCGCVDLCKVCSPIQKEKCPSCHTMLPVLGCILPKKQLW